MITVSSLQPETRKALAYGLTAVLAFVIAALTLLPLPAPPLAADGGDKVYHFIAFTGLILPVATLRPKALVWIIPAALLFGAGIEILQPFVNRSRDPADFWADAAGVLAGAAIGAALHRFT